MHLKQLIEALEKYDAAQPVALGDREITHGTQGAGSILEVEYLYCHKGPAGKLHQPVFLEERTDTSDLDCQEIKLQVEPSEDD